MSLLLLGAGYAIFRSTRGRPAEGQSVREIPPAEVAADPIDEASWESFPASDPPSRTPVTGYGRPNGEHRNI